MLSFEFDKYDTHARESCTAACHKHICMYRVYLRATIGQRNVIVNCLGGEH